MLGDERINYPEYHIEADNRLSWFFGKLDERYGDEAVYIHLLRNREATVKSFLNRWGVKGSIIHAFQSGILISRYGKWKDTEKGRICEDYYDTVNLNIRHFLKDKSKVQVIQLENINEDFRVFWEFIGAEGDLEGALKVFNRPDNTSQSQQTLRNKLRTLIYHLKKQFNILS